MKNQTSFFCEGNRPMEKAITIIQKQETSEEIIRVAVYARVSTKTGNQASSLENQIQHYQDTVGNDPQYELVEIYYDFGISGYKESRPGFQKMMEDAEAGKFNLIITKAITRFARNTQTVLDSTRKLKELGIGVYFELQGINTLSQEGELLMTLFAAFGQAESEGARRHTLMALKRKYDKGEPPRRLERSMGYAKGDDGEFYPDEYAPLVLEMFEMAAEGYSASQITNYLNAEGRKNHNGKAFERSSVTRLLRNPVYKGDFIGQQYFVDENRRLRKNNGEKPIYYIEEDHIPIVSTALWEKAQRTLDTITRRASPTKSKPLDLNDENYPYRRLLFCAECGHRLMRSVRGGRVLWECSGKTRFSKDFCSGVCVTDDEIRSWAAIEKPIYISPVIEKGVVKCHNFVNEINWKQSHSKKNHNVMTPALTEENYPYMNHIFCKYCGSRLRRIISNTGKVTWICDGLSRKGKQFCKGIRVPDTKLKPLVEKSGDFYIGKEKIHGKESYGYSRKPDCKKDE